MLPDLSEFADQFADLVAQKVAIRLERSLADDILTTKQAAELLKLHPNTVSVRAGQGKIPAHKFGTTWRFRRSALLDHVTPTRIERG